MGVAPGRPIPPTFMGLSHEWDQNFIGDSVSGVNNIYRQLLSNLTSYGSGPLVLRIGGNTSDHNQELSPAIVRPFAELSKALGIRFILGVNLGAGDVKLAGDQARTLANLMPPGSIIGFEVGNEPDLYYRNGLRSSTYKVTDFFADFQRSKSYLLPTLPPGLKLVGPAWGSTGMLPNLPQFLAQNANALALVSQHNYFTSPSAHPPDDILLTPIAATKAPLAVAPAVVAAHSYRLPFRMDELNSADGSGVHGVSDTFGAALWGLDTMFEFANVGVDGLNWESNNWSSSSVKLASFSATKAGGYTSYRLQAVSPLYYGLLMFQAATGNGARLLSVNLSTRANMKAWATIDQTGIAKLVLINKEKSQSGYVLVKVPGYTRASIYRLSAPSYTSTADVQYGGQTIDPDGRLHGTLRAETLTSVNGDFGIALPALSAAMVVYNK